MKFLLLQLLVCTTSAFSTSISAARNFENTPFEHSTLPETPTTTLSPTSFQEPVGEPLGYTFYHTWGPTPLPLPLPVQKRGPTKWTGFAEQPVRTATMLNSWRRFTLVIGERTCPPEFSHFRGVQGRLDGTGKEGLGTLGWFVSDEPEAIFYAQGEYGKKDELKIYAEGSWVDMSYGLYDKGRQWPVFLSPFVFKRFRQQDIYAFKFTDELDKINEKLSDGWWIGQRDYVRPDSRMRKRDVLDWGERRDKAWMACPKSDHYVLMVNLQSNEGDMEPWFVNCTKGFDLEVKWWWETGWKTYQEHGIEDALESGR